MMSCNRGALFQTAVFHHGLGRFPTIGFRRAPCSGDPGTSLKSVRFLCLPVRGICPSVGIPTKVDTLPTSRIHLVVAVLSRIRCPQPSQCGMKA